MSLLDFFFPEHCLVCGRAGVAVCARHFSLAENCCLECGNYLENGRCLECALPYGRSIMLGFRDELVGALAEQLKFDAKRGLAKPLARQLVLALSPIKNCNASLLSRQSELSRGFIVPIPTLKKHVRQRGLDHTALVARQIAKNSGLKYAPLLKRTKNIVQTGQNYRIRQKQAEGMFLCTAKLDPKTDYYAYDDISTTGATLKAACETLRKAGARKITVLVLAKTR